MVIFSRDAIAKALILAIVSKGEKYRENAIEAAAIFGDHELHQDYYRCDYYRCIEVLENWCSEKTDEHLFKLLGSGFFNQQQKYLTEIKRESYLKHIKVDEMAVVCCQRCFFSIQIELS